MKTGMKQNPMENVIWWLEYLSKTKGANHLKLSSRHLNIIQYFSLDFLFIVAITLYIIVKFLKSMVCKTKSAEKSKTE